MEVLITQYQQLSMLNDYESVNIVRQPCNRGRKGQVPSLSTKNWISTIPSSGQKTGYMGELFGIWRMV